MDFTEETVSGSGISWAICKSAPRSRQTTTPAPLSFLQAGCPSCRPTNSVKASTEGTHTYTHNRLTAFCLKHWRHGEHFSNNTIQVQSRLNMDNLLLWGCRRMHRTNSNSLTLTGRVLSPAELWHHVCFQPTWNPYLPCNLQFPAAMV